MALSKEDIKKRRWKSILTDRGAKIFKLYFLNKKSQEEIRRNLYGEYKKTHSNVIDIQSLTNLVSNYTTAWKELGYLNEEKIKLKNPKSKSHPNELRYSANMKVYFDYAKSKLGGRELHQLVKGIISHIFSFDEPREIVCRYQNLIEGVTSFLERIFLFRGNLEFDELLGLQYVKSFFVKNKKYIKKCNELNDQFEEFWKVCIRHGDYLINKIRILSKFSDKDYKELMIKEEIREYYNLPFSIDKGITKKEKRELLNKFSLIFYKDIESKNIPKFDDKKQINEQVLY